MEITKETVKVGLIGEIQSCISDWLALNSETRSVAFLSRNTGVSDSSIRRLMNSNIKIADDSIFKILLFIKKVRTLSELKATLNKSTELYIWLNKAFAYLDENPAVESFDYTNNEDDLAANIFSLSIYALVSSSTGLTEKYIVEQFGARGRLELENLILKKIVKVLGDGSLTVDNKDVFLSREKVIELLPSLTTLYFKKENPFNARTLNMDTVNINGYHKIMDAYDAFNKELADIIKSEKGEIPVITAGFFDTMTTVPYFVRGENENN